MDVNMDFITMIIQQILKPPTLLESYRGFTLSFVVLVGKYENNKSTYKKLTRIIDRSNKDTKSEET